MARDLKALRAYLSEFVGKPALKRPPIAGIGCLSTPFLVVGLSLASRSWTFAEVGLALFLGIPAYIGILFALDRYFAKPKSAHDRLAVQRSFIRERLQNETRRKVNGDRILLVLMESCAHSRARILGAFAQPIWVQSEKFWAEWRDKSLAATDAAMNEAIDQTAPFLMGPKSVPIKSKIESVLEDLLFTVEEKLPADLPPQYGSLFMIAAEMRQLAEEIELQTANLHSQGLGAALPSTDQIRDVLTHLEEIRKAQNELDGTVETSG